MAHLIIRKRTLADDHTRDASPPRGDGPEHIRGGEVGVDDIRGLRPEDPLQFPDGLQVHEGVVRWNWPCPFRVSDHGNR